MMLEIRNDVARRTAVSAADDGWQMPMTVDAGVAAAAAADPAGSSILTRRTRAREGAS